VLSGVILLLIVCAPIRVLGWLFDHGHAAVSTLGDRSFVVLAWWQEWFGNVIVFAFIAIVLLGIVNA
jgi:hypothetical protein